MLSKKCWHAQYLNGCSDNNKKSYNKHTIYKRTKYIQRLFHPIHHSMPSFTHSNRANIHIDWKCIWMNKANNNNNRKWICCATHFMFAIDVDIDNNDVSLISSVHDAMNFEMAENEAKKRRINRTSTKTLPVLTTPKCFSIFFQFHRLLSSAIIRFLTSHLWSVHCSSVTSVHMLLLFYKGARKEKKTTHS